MHQFAKVLKLLSDTKILRAVGDISSVIDSYLELKPEDRCVVARDLSKHAEALILKARQNERNEKENLNNDSKHRS